MTPLSDLCPLLNMFKHKPVKKDSVLVYLLSPITSSLLITTSILMHPSGCLAVPSAARCLVDVPSL